MLERLGSTCLRTHSHFSVIYEEATVRGVRSFKQDHSIIMAALLGEYDVHGRIVRRKNAQS